MAKVKDYRNDGSYWAKVFSAAAKNLTNNPNMSPEIACNNAVNEVDEEYLGEDLFPNNKDL